MGWKGILISIAVSLTLGACVYYPTIPNLEELEAMPQVSTAPKGKDYVIGPEDILTIQVWDQPDLEREVQVSREGDFTYPFIGKVHAAGLTVRELEREIARRLADGYIVNPQVTVTVKEPKVEYFYVFGEVKKPGKYEMERGETITVLKAISIAGGVTEKAAINKTRIVREKDGVRMKIKAKLTDPVLPEDVIIVPETFF